MKKFATIGRGFIVDAFIESAKSTGLWQLDAVYSRSLDSGKSYADRHGAKKVYTDLVSLAADPDIDGVYVASPNALHVEQCRFLMEAGKHILCEKPLAARADEVIELQELAAAKSVVYLEAIMYMHTPLRQALRQAVGACGQIFTARLDFSKRSAHYDAYLRGETPNIFNPALETGALMDLGIYTVYPALDLFGMPQKISADASLLRTGADGAGCAVLSYPDKQVVLTYAKTAQCIIGSEIVGQEGTVTFGTISQLQDICLYPRNGAAMAVAENETRLQLMAHEAENWYRFIEDPTDASYADCKRLALQTATVMEEIRRQAGVRFPKDK
ncbi:MAG: Gfo/Idh/MocA family oxidoreductase [Clostridia bacterium]|nr:Gfo/Idh/MocA family oxidoreductase [Clostridia bacterium]